MFFVTFVVIKNFRCSSLFVANFNEGFMEALRVVFAGGGTGGHLYPCLALAHLFQEREAKTEVLFIGTETGLEAKVVPAHGFAFQTVPARGVIGKSLLGQCLALCLLPVGIVKAIRHLRQFAPQLVIGIGGYAAGPVLMAALFLNVKRVLLEPNVVPGLINKLMAPFAHLTVTAFEETRHYLYAHKIACLGVPVRSDIAALRFKTTQNRSENDLTTVLVIGGSQGARRINQAMIEALPFLEGYPLRIIHQTGEKDFSRVQAAYKAHQVKADVMPFIRKMADVYAVSDLVLSRAGAATLSELAIAGLPSILVPFPHAKGHQEKNAKPFVESGAAEIILDHALVEKGGTMLAERMISLLYDSQKRAKMAEAAQRLSRPNAADHIVTTCFQLVGAG